MTSEEFKVWRILEEAETKDEHGTIRVVTKKQLVGEIGKPKEEIYATKATISSKSPKKFTGAIWFQKNNSSARRPILSRAILSCVTARGLYIWTGGENESCRATGAGVSLPSSLRLC